MTVMQDSFVVVEFGTHVVWFDDRDDVITFQGQIR